MLFYGTALAEPDQPTVDVTLAMSTTETQARAPDQGAVAAEATALGYAYTGPPIMFDELLVGL